MNLNKVTLIGNLTKDVEKKSLPSGQAVASLGLATNRSWKDKDGNKQEQVEFHNLIAFGQTAENLAKFCVKGQTMFFEGRLQTRGWEKDGQKHQKTEIIIDTFQFGKKPETKGEYNVPPQAKEEVPDFPF